MSLNGVSAVIRKAENWKLDEINHFDVRVVIMEASQFHVLFHTCFFFHFNNFSLSFVIKLELVSIVSPE